MSEKAEKEALKVIRKARRDGEARVSLQRFGLTRLPEEIIELKHLKHLNLNGNEFSEFPSSLLHLTELQELYMFRCGLTSLPAGISKLKRLVEFNLTQNFLDRLPDGICALSDLQVLYLGGNSINKLPEEFYRLGELTNLYLHDNQFSSFPTSLRNYGSLVDLTIGSELRTLPKRINKFKKLRRLSLAHNKLETIPHEISSMDSMESLEVQHNRLNHFPPEIANGKEMSQILLYGNDLPSSVVSAGADSQSVLFAQLRSLTDPSMVDEIREAKLMITGEGKVGKSCLRRALNGSLDKDSDLSSSTTWGVDCGVLEIEDESSGDDRIKFNYWDFGGQKVYRITHQFFYSDQGLYLLVWDPRLGEDQCLIRDWLVRIAARTAGIAKVIIVATHAEVEGGNYRPEVDLSNYRDELRGLVVDQISVDSFTGYNIAELKRLMVLHAGGLPGVRSPINKNWDRARDQALSIDNSAPWMSYKNFSEICQSNGVDDEEAIRSIAATFLHRLGRGVWYGMDWADDAFLCDTIVRDPSWLAMAFMEVVQHEPTRLSGGILDHANLSDVWINHGREGDGWRVYQLDDHQRLLRMMRAQGVALPTKASDGERSLVPQLVPADVPDLPWVSQEDLAVDQRVIRMHSRIEPVLDGLMSHLIAVLEPYHYYLPDGRGGFWQNGIFLRNHAARFRSEAMLEIKAERNYLDLSICVVGDEPGFLLHQIDSSIDECLKFWPGASRSDTVMCPQLDRGVRCTGQFKLENVERWLAQGRSYAICHECDQATPPGDLIYGLKRRDLSEDTSRHLLQYLAYKEQRPAPASIVIFPTKSRWRDIRSWEILGRTRLKVQLRSELSGEVVCEKEFTASAGLLKYIGPAAKLGAIFFAAVPLPLSLPEDVTESLSEVSDALEKISGGVATGETDPDLRDQIGSKNLALVARFLKELGIEPRALGMDIEKAPDGKWYWMSPSEVDRHRPTPAALPS